MCKDVSCFLRLPVVYPISTVYHVEVCQLVCCQELKYAGTNMQSGVFLYKCTMRPQRRHQTPQFKGF